MTDEGKWGPWIDHDGKGCPCVGMVVNGVHRDGTAGIWVAGTRVVGGREHVGDGWVWGSCHPIWRHVEIIRYRIRKPRALLQLIEMVESLPAKPQEVDA